MAQTLRKWWPEQKADAEKEAQMARKLLVQGYDACADCDYFSVMTRDEYDTERNICRNNPYHGWIHLIDDYSATIETPVPAYAYLYE